jgi:hypothetical protein
MIQFLHSGLQGAPSNIIPAGAMCAIADDCLVNGFNVLAPISVTVSAGVATIAYAVPHGHTADQYMRVLGASVSQVNGDKRPTILTTTTLTVPAPGAPDGAVGGTVSTRFAPLGWQQAFSDSNVRVYRSPNLQGSRLFYQLRDTSAVFLSASWRGFETMSDAHTGTGPFPSTAQAANGLLFYKNNSETPLRWALVGDDRTFYLFLQTDPTVALIPLCVGDFESYLPGDAFGGIVTAISAGSVDNLAQPISTGHYVARSFGGGGSQPVSTYGPFGVPSGTQGAYPSAASGGACFARPLHVVEGSTLRGALRGLMHVWEPIPSWPFTVVESAQGVDGRVLTLLGGVIARVAFPLDEPW